MEEKVSDWNTVVPFLNDFDLLRIIWATPRLCLRFENYSHKAVIYRRRVCEGATGATALHKRKDDVSDCDASSMRDTELFCLFKMLKG